MKHPKDNKTVDWVGTPVNQVAIFERVVRVLKTIKTTPIATTSVLHEKALSDVCLRSAQRYLKGLEQSGYVKKISGHGWDHYESRFFLTDKAKELFGVTV